MAEKESVEDENIEKEDSIEENFEDGFNAEQNSVEDLEALHEMNERIDSLKTHNKIKTTLCGSIVELEKGYSKITLQTTSEMSLDEFGLVHSGFIFGAADYTAAVAVNEKNVVIIDSRSKFLAPAKVGDLIEFEAWSRYEDTRKREIRVKAHINNIKIYEGIFQAVVLEDHIFNIKIKNARRSYG